MAISYPKSQHHEKHAVKPITQKKIDPEPDPDFRFLCEHEASVELNKANITVIVWPKTGVCVEPKREYHNNY